MNKLKNIKKWFLSLSKVKKVLLGVILIILIFLIYKIFFSKKQTTTVTTSTVARGTIISTVSESGNVVAATQVTVGSPTDGVIKTLYVKNGDDVVAGQKLYEVKSTATEQEKATAYASYLSAVNSEKTAEANKTGSQSTLEKDRQSVIDASSAVTDMQNNLNNSQPNPATKQTYTQNEIDSINSSLTSAKDTFSADEQKYNTADNNIGASKASLSAAWLNYEATQDSVVTAPIDGIVANLSVAVGSTVAASTTNANSTSGSSTSSSSSNTGTSVLIIGNFDNMVINTSVNEIDITKIKAGQNATVTLDAFADKTFVGKVYSVDSIGAISSGVVSYNVYIKLIDPPPTIHSGMTASVIIQTDRKDNALSVPTTAIQTNNGQSFVRVQKNGKTTQVAVTTGIVSDTDTEITSGLSEGDIVVTSNLSTTSAAGTSGSTSPFSAIGGGRGGGGGAAVFRRGN